MLGSVEEFCEWAGIDSESLTDEDAIFIETQLTLLDEAVRTYCRREFELKTYKQTFYSEDYYPERELQLYQYPVKELISVEEDSVALTEDQLEEIRLHKPTAILKRRSGFHLAMETEVTYSAGYEIIPPIIMNVIYSITQERYNKKKAGIQLSFGSDVQRVSIPGTISVDFDYSLQNNESTSRLGTILGSYVNQLNEYRSERTVIGSGKLQYVEEETP